MATTTRLTLFKPAGSDTVDRVVDFNNNWDLIDSKIGRVVCTSATRPTGGNLYNGLPIYETDTGNYYTYDSVATTWQPELAYSTPGAQIMKLTKTVSIGWGSSVLTTNASGDVNLGAAIIAACSWTALQRMLFTNGDGVTRVNMVMGGTGTFPTAGTANVRCWVGNTAAVVASANARFDWVAWGN